MHAKGKKNYCQQRSWLNFVKEDQFLTAPLQHPSLSFRELQELRNTESKLLVALSILKATFHIIEGLESYGRSLEKINSNTVPNPYFDGDDLVRLSSLEMQALKTLRLRCKGYLDSVKVIRNRFEMLVGLVSPSGEIARLSKRGDM